MRKNNIIREGNTVTLNYFNGIFKLDKEVEKIIFKNTCCIDESFTFGYLHKFKNLKEIQIDYPGDLYSSGDMLFFRTQKKLSLVFCIGNEKHVTIPDGVNIIGNGAFQETSIESVMFPYSLEEIADWAFSGCKLLSEVVFPQSLRYIGKYAFYGCLSLKRIDIPGSVQMVGSDAFCNCHSLSQVDFHYGTVSIGEYAFRYCGLKEISLPASIVTLDWKCFGGIECCRVETFIPGLIFTIVNCSESRGKSVCVDCGQDKIILPGIMSRSSIAGATEIYRNIMKHPNGSIHVLHNLGYTTYTKHQAALSGYSLSKDEELKKYLKRNGSKMVEEAEDEEELLKLFQDFGDIGFSKGMIEKALARSEENKWAFAAAYVLELSRKSQKSSFSL